MVKKSSESSTTSAVNGDSSINPLTSTWEKKDTPPRRSPYDRVRTVLETGSESFTQQADKDRTDINNIVNHFARTGEFPFSAVRKAEPQYGDVSDISHSSLDELIQKREEAIERLTGIENDMALANQPGLAEEISNLVETLQNTQIEESTAPAQTTDQPTD